MPVRPGRAWPDAGLPPRRGPPGYDGLARSGTCSCADRGHSCRSPPPSGTCRSETRSLGRSSRSPRDGSHGRVAPVRLRNPPVIEVVFGLEALVARQTHARACVESLSEPRVTVVRGSICPNFPGFDQVCMGAERLFKRRVRVVLVRLVQVDVVGLQPLEGRLDRRVDVSGREALLPPNLGRGGRLFPGFRMPSSNAR
jgi:hypothetical protein